MKHVPTKPLWQLTASELVAAYRAGQATPTTVLNAVLGRCETVNASLNAIVTLDIPGARRAAAASDRRWREGQPLGALDGVPITVKDSILVQGLRATWGSRLYSDFVPTVDEEPVARLRAAGAVILGKTNVPEFTLHGYTDNILFGATRNPWNPALTPGGSSGGAVAATASGLGAIALCTDGGGSIRRPAAHTGLVGFKPSRGMVPRSNGFPVILHDFEVAGPVARCVDDVTLAMSTIAGQHWNEAHEAAFGRSLKILHIPTFSNAPVDPVIADAIDDVAARLVAKGHDVERANDFVLAARIPEVWPVISQTGLAWLMAQHGDVGDKVSPTLAEMARNGQKYSSVDFYHALDVIKQVERDFVALFANYDLLLTPATAAMPWPAAQPYPPTINGETVGPRGHAVFTPFANALGLPAISLPCPVGGGAMPIGYQLCGANGSDRALLAFAASIDKAFHAERAWPPM